LSQRQVAGEYHPYYDSVQAGLNPRAETEADPPKLKKSVNNCNKLLRNSIFLFSASKRNNHSDLKEVVRKLLWRTRKQKTKLSRKRLTIH
jgi:hypothetical protein